MLTLRPVQKTALILALLIVIINIALLTYAYLSAGSQYVFGGLLFNPLDGNSYLAKIQQGFNGSWRFTLPYECESGQGAYVILYYLFLGHLARLLGVSVIFIFHFSRLVNCLILIFILATYFEKVIPDPAWSKRALWLAGLGSGMGWLVLPFGIMTSDMWLAEAYPFLSMFANPHFPLGLALFLAIILLALDADTWRNAILVGVLSLLLAVIQLFMVVTVLLVIAIITVVWWNHYKEYHLKCLVFSLFFSLPYMLYQYWALNTDPILAQWTAQNQTPSPAVWDLILSLSPVVIFAVVALLRYKKISSEYRLIVAAWLFVTIILTYIPMALQRRFLSGVYVAGVQLAVLGILTFFNNKRLMSRLYRILLLLSLPGTLIILLLSMFGVSTHSPAMYLTNAEMQALSWLKSNSPNGSLVLASPGMGGFIPAYSGNCVIYGHPFETLDQEASKKSVIAILNGGMSSLQIDEFIHREGVDYVFFGPREKALGDPHYFKTLPIVFSNDNVIIYQVYPD